MTTYAIIEQSIIEDRDSMVWEKTDEKLPELDELVLIRDKDMRSEYQFYTAKLTGDYENCKLVWKSMWGGTVYSDASGDSITHWMRIRMPA